MGIVNYVILAVTLLVVALIVFWYYKNRGPQQSLRPSMNKGEVVGIIPRYWKSIDAVSYTHLTLPTKRIV